MAPLKIAVSLDNVPQMLRTIVLQALQREPSVQLAGADQAADALIASGITAPLELLRRGALSRVIDLAADGRQATVHRLRHECWAVVDPSPDKLLALLHDAGPPAAASEAAPRGGFSILRDWFASRRAVATRAAAASEPEPAPAPFLPPAAESPKGRDPIGQSLARLATRILATRAPGPGHEGPGAELAALARQLAAAAEGAAPDLPGLEHAASCFGLRDDERDLLLLAALVEVDARAARLVALLNDHMSRTRPTVGAVRDLDGSLDAVVERLVTSGPLMRLALISLEGDGPLATRAVKVDDAVWPLLLGLQRSAPFVLQPLAEVPLQRLALPEENRLACAQASAWAAGRGASTVLVVVVGDDGVGRVPMARAIAAAWRTQAIMVDGAELVSAERIAALAREAVWAHAAVIVTRAEVLALPLWRLLTERLDAPLLATSSTASLAALATHASRPLIEVKAPPRDAAQRMRLWRAAAPAAWEEASLRDLAERFDFGRDQIDAALALAATRVQATAAAGARKEASPADARAACEILRETRFAGTAERIACPYEASDIVLRPETRRELDLAIAWARHAARLFIAGGPGAALRAGGGLPCLFSGPPGGGKTMAAQIMAREIDYALFRVDLSQVVDKFIGESEKKLAALFDEAQRARVALFFDEADALFGKRTEVRDSHDRYANITVDYLLQRIESFDGMAILATNYAANIDDAFMRRMRIRASFPAPDAADRRRIWAKLLPESSSRDEDIDIAQLADAYELVGGEIRNAIYTAHLLAAEEGCMLAMRHCVAGLERELNKTGRIANLAPLRTWHAK